MPYSKQELLEARRQISSTLHKLEETVRTLEGKENPARCKPQITLADGRNGELAFRWNRNGRKAHPHK